MEKIDKIINEVLASFQIDHIDVPIEAICRAKENLEKQLLNKNRRNKALVRRIERVK